MRVLLIDNYDSFTWNLYQAISAFTSDIPVVIRNDEWSWQKIEAERFDRIVISPGPGKPSVACDFGVCEDVLRQATAPVLGVCLGHQGLGFLYGAKVTHAPVPMHGRLSRIFHTGEGIFSNIPNPFSAVRYHSLIVSDLPDILECIAWTDDGLVMGLRHRERPLYGVQFHPESVCTEYGGRLLNNFLDERDRSTKFFDFADRRPAPEQTPEAATPAYRVISKQLGKDCDSERIFLTLFAEEPDSFWLDSSRPDRDFARFSFMGDAGGSCGAVVRYSRCDGGFTVTQKSGETKYSGDIFEYLRRELERMSSTTQSPLPLPFQTGYVGYFGYEVRPEQPSMVYSRQPDAIFIRPGRMIAIDHAEKRAWLLYLADTIDDAAAEQWFQRASRAVQSAIEPTLEPARPLAADGVSMRLDISPAHYVALINRCLEYIRDGEAYELCLTNKLRLAGSVDSLALFLALRRSNPAPYAAYFRWKEMAVVSSSPECFLRIAADGTVTTKPIKGTARRDADPERDAAIRHQLADDEKTRAENLMIVDLLRNDLGRVCEIGSVRVTDLMAIESYATVHQMVSTIRGKLRPDRSAIDCIKAAFPGGSMTGAPKLRAMSILESLEAAARGVYSGAIGFLGPDGSATLSVVIRTAIVTDSEVSIGTGGAIVAMSDPLSEFRETLVKVEPILMAYAKAVHLPPADLLSRLWSFEKEMH